MILPAQSSVEDQTKMFVLMHFFNSFIIKVVKLVSRICDFMIIIYAIAIKSIQKAQISYKLISSSLPPYCPDS